MNATYLTKLFLRTFWNNIKEFYNSKKLFFWMWLLVSLVFEFLILVGVGSLFYFLINHFPGGYIFAPKLLGIIIMMVFFFIAFLSFISAIPTLYSSRENYFLLSKPVAYVDIFKYGYFKILFYSSWGSIFILLPVFLTFGIVNGLGPAYYLLAFFAVASITILASLLGSGALMFIGKIILQFSQKVRNTIFAILGIILLVFAINKVPQFTIVNEGTETSLMEDYIFNYNYENLFLPSNWFSKLVQYYIDLDWIGVLAVLFFIVCTTALVYQLIVTFADKYYFDSMVNINKFYIFKNKKKKKLKSIFGDNMYLNILKKDLLLHLKDPAQFSQIITFGVLMLMFIMTLKGINITKIDRPLIAATLSYINIGVVGFMLSSIALRFVYPNISLEGRSFWVIKTMPIKLSHFYYLKLVFFLSFFLIMGIAISLFYSRMLGITTVMTQLSLLIIIPIIIFLVSLYFVLGNIAPNFKEKNPSKIATSVPGLLGVLLSNIYVGLVVLVLRGGIMEYYNNLLYCNEFGLGYFWREVVVIYVVTGVLVVGMNIVGFRKFREIEM